VNTDLLWLDSDAVSSNSSISSTIVDAKGDLIAATANDAVTRLGVGADDTVLMARASEATGLVFAAPRLAGGAARPLLTSGARLSGSGLVLGGIASNFASSPDSAALSITGDIDIKAKVTMTDWTPAGLSATVSKWQSATNKSYFLAVNTNGTLQFWYSSDGSAGLTATSTVATGFADGSTNWIRATLDADDGSSQRLVKFYTSSDGTAWTQLGTTITVAGAITLFDGTAILEIGANFAGIANIVSGTIARAIIQSAFDTANNTDNLVYDANFETATADALAFTESSTNAATVTINTTRYSYGIPNTSFSTLTTHAPAANEDRYQRFLVTEPIAVDMVAAEVTSAPASNATIHYGIYATTDDFQPTGNVLATASASVASGATGLYFVQFTPVTLQPGTYVLGINSSVSMTMRIVTGGIATIARHSASEFRSPSIIYRSRTAATFANNPQPWTLTSNGTLGLYYWAFLRWSPA
jgi:hypothetical protein